MGAHRGLSGAGRSCRSLLGAQICQHVCPVLVQKQALEADLGLSVQRWERKRHSGGGRHSGKRSNIEGGQQNSSVCDGVPGCCQNPTRCSHQSLFARQNRSVWQSVPSSGQPGQTAPLPPSRHSSLLT